MKFQINLKPYPGAEYFTLQEHRRKSVDGKLNDYLNEIDFKLKLLFGIPGGFECDFLDKETYKQSIGSETPIVDNPNDGSLLDLPQVNSGLIDLSYSFPQIPELPKDHFHGIIIDPSASLGVETSFVCVVGTNLNFNTTSIQATGDSWKMDAFLLTQVLGDIQEKGMAMILRESNYKAAVLNQLIQANPNLEFLPNIEHKSKVMISFQCESDFLSNIEKLGYSLKSENSDGLATVVMANYATHSKELIEMFVDRVDAL